MFRPTVAGSFLLSTLAVASLDAQAVQGRIVDPDGSPLAVALVSLLDRNLHVVRTSLTGDGGEFSHAASEVGRYSLRVERIGFAEHLTPGFDLGDGETLELAITFSAPPVRLDGIGGGIASVCANPPEDGTELASLWEAARRALEITNAIDPAGLTRIGAVRYLREIDGLDLRQSSLHSLEEVLPGPGALDDETIAAVVRDGFALLPGDGTVLFNGVSPAILLSAPFLERHCFDQVLEDREAVELIGLGFQPILPADLVGLGGVIWLDRRTGEMHSVDYSYLDPLGRLPAGAGGRMEFVRLPNELPVLSRWWTRLPSGFDLANPDTANRVTSFREGGGVLLDEAGAPLGRDDGVAGLLAELLAAARETAPDTTSFDGIDAVLADILASSRFTGGSGRVDGFIGGGTNGEGVADALVALDRAPLRYVARTDDTGHFHFAGIEEGSYRLTVRHPAFPDIDDVIVVGGAGTLTRLDAAMARAGVDTARVVVTVDRVVDLDGVVASADGRPTFGPLVAVYERFDRERRLGLGRLWDRNDLEASGASSFADLLHAVAGVRAVGGTISVNPLCDGPPQLYVDGVLYGVGLPPPEIHFNSVEVLEVYRRTSQIPAEFWRGNPRRGFGDPRCGVIAVWTRRGR